MKTYTTDSALLSGARLIVKFGTDGQWYWGNYDAIAGWAWDAEPGSPDVTVLVIEALRHDLRLSWTRAVKATLLLVDHPWVPTSFKPDVPSKEFYVPSGY